MITRQSTLTMPRETYTKTAGSTSSNKPITRMRTAITAIPNPVVLHNFFSSYFAFSSFDAVLYPEINQLPCPESNIMEITKNIRNTTHIIQSAPLDTSANFIFHHLCDFYIPYAFFYHMYRLDPHFIRNVLIKLHSFIYHHMAVIVAICFARMVPRLFSRAIMYFIYISAFIQIIFLKIKQFFKFFI